MSAKTNKILVEDVHPLTIIREVQKWPILYSRESRERGNGHLNKKIWYKVAKFVLTEWDSYSDTEKDSKVRQLSKRWRNLRDTFKRQVELEKRVREGKGIKNRTYIYFKYMLFLLPHVTPVEEEENEVINPKLETYFKTTKKTEESSPKWKIEEHFIDETPISIPPASLKICETDKIDEDRHFALSLIPTLKKMSDDEKLIAKMEILKVLQKVRSQSTREKAEDLIYSVEEVGNTVKIEFFEEEEREYTTSMSGEIGNSD